MLPSSASRRAETSPTVEPGKLGSFILGHIWSVPPVRGFDQPVAAQRVTQTRVASGTEPARTERTRSLRRASWPPGCRLRRSPLLVQLGHGAAAANTSGGEISMAGSAATNSRPISHRLAALRATPFVVSSSAWTADGETRPRSPSSRARPRHWCRGAVTLHHQPPAEADPSFAHRTSPGGIGPAR
jgi:hypothetical protein